MLEEDSIAVDRVISKIRLKPFFFFATGNSPMQSTLLYYSSFYLDLDPNGRPTSPSSFQDSPRSLLFEIPSYSPFLYFITQSPHYILLHVIIPSRQVH